MSKVHVKALHFFNMRKESFFKKLINKKTLLPDLERQNFSAYPSRTGLRRLFASLSKRVGAEGLAINKVRMSRC